MTAARLKRVFRDVEAMSQHLLRNVRVQSPAATLAQARTVVALAESLLPREEVPQAEPVKPRWMSGNGCRNATWSAESLGSGDRCAVCERRMFKR